MKPTSKHRRTRRHPQVARRLIFEALEDRRLLAVDATLSLGLPEITGTVAEFEVALDYAATSGEVLAFFSLDVAPSSPALSGSGTDYSAFSFAPNSPLLDDWTQIGEFDDPGAPSSVEFDDSLVASLPTGTYTLGTLRVDFGAAGLGLGDVFTVSLAGFDTVIGVEHPSQGFSFQPVQFDPGSRTVLQVALSGPPVVQEGSTYTLTIDKPNTSDVDVFIDWGDGQQDTIDIADLPESGEVPHVFADGNSQSTIHVEILFPDGTRATAGELSVTIDNVAPVIELIGDAVVDEGTPFTLTLGAVTDPGDDTVTQFLIDWDDGQQSVIDAADLPADRAVTHTYADGVAFATIVVNLVDEDGTHETAGSLSLTVNNVAPTVSLSGSPRVDEGSPYTLTIGGVLDPGIDTVTQYVIDWGDGIQQTVDAADLPANRAVIHTFVDDAELRSITVALVDEDGTHATAGILEVTVDNVPPTVTLTGSGGIDEGTTYTLTIGAVIDPGDDTVTQYVIDWGDGTQQIIDAADLPATRQVTHTFATSSTPTIVVGLIDEDGTHTTAGTVSVVVMNVPPTVTLTGLASVDEGTAYILTIGPIVDPGGDTVTRYVIDWGDGIQEMIEAVDLPADRTAIHVFADGDAARTIVVDLVDGDGSHPAAGRLDLMVRNVAPIVSLVAPAIADIDRPFTLMIGEVVDPGDDVVTQYVIDWGDGTQQVIDAVDLPVSREVSHTYSDVTMPPTIGVELVDEDGRYAGASLAITVLPQLLDFGDAPSSFGTLRDDDGARHIAVGPRLGLERDAEADARQPLDGTGDDAFDTGGTDDEDGVIISNDFTLVAAAMGKATVHIGGVAMETARLFAWIDFDGDGMFEPEEQISDGSTPLTYGDHDILFDVPDTGFRGTTYARFRVASQMGLGPSGPASDGEVEDYSLTIERPEPACLTGQPLEAGGFRLIYSCVTPGSLSAFVVGTEFGSYFFPEYNRAVEIANAEVVALGVGNPSGITVAHVDLPSKFAGQAVIFQAFEMNPNPQLSNTLVMNEFQATLLASGVGPGAPSITSQDLDTLVDAAIARWDSVGLTEREHETLWRTQISIADLPDGIVGATSDGQVFLDVNAAGQGWFIDSTPDDDREFEAIAGISQLTALAAPASERLDALTALMHELGHVLGMPDLPSGVGPNHLMQHRLDPGIRRLPVSHTNWRLAEDVNADGNVSPMDALLVINVLNGMYDWSPEGRPELVSTTGQAAAAFLDTDHDNYLSPRDVLGVVNYLNRDLANSGEAEAIAISSSSLAAQILKTHASKTKSGFVPLSRDLRESPAGEIDLGRRRLRRTTMQLGFAGQIREFPAKESSKPLAARPRIEINGPDLEELFDKLATDVALGWHSES